MSVHSELCEALGVKFKKGGDVQDHLMKLVKANDKIDDDTWDAMSAKAQEWIGEAVDAAKANTELPLPPGFVGGDKPAKANGKAEKGKVKAKGRRASTEDEDEAKPAKKAKATEAKVKGKSATKAKANGKAKKANGDGAGGKRARLYEVHQKIKLLVKKNPKQEGRDSYDRFEHYFDKKVKTVGDALKAGVRSGDLKWDVDHEYIEIT
jgi:hypothetical protein